MCAVYGCNVENKYQAMYGCATVDAEPIFCRRKVVDHSLGLQLG
jgi:hypothetical protein